MKKVEIKLPVLLPDIPDKEDQCVTRLINVLESKNGVDEAHVKLKGNLAQLCIHFDPELITLQQIKQMARQYGSELHDTYGHLLVEVEGIRHPRQAKSISKQLQKMEGVVEAFAGASGWIRFEYDRREINNETLVNQLKEFGLTVIQKVEGHQADREITVPERTEMEVSSKSSEEDRSDRISEEERAPTSKARETGKEEQEHNHGGIFGEKTELIFSLIAGGLLGLGFGLSYAAGVPVWIVTGLYIGSYFFGGYYLVQEAFRELKAGNFEIDFLMLVAAVGAAVLDAWAEGALLLFLFSMGHALEHYAMSRAREAIKGLTELTPDTALKKENGDTREVPIENLEIGDVILVRPNSKIAADGIVVDGSSSVNQAPVTGESVPVEKQSFADRNKIEKNPGDIEDRYRVFAGTINGNSRLEVQVTKRSEDSTLSRLIQLVNEAEAQKSPTQQFTDKFEKYFVPAVLGLVVVLNFAFLVVDESYGTSFYRSMAVLVAASPCALAISTPSAVLSGVARAARMGVLIKGGRPLENLGILKVLAFDKTGTLTEGKPKVTDVIPLNGSSEKEMLKTAVAVEKMSDHPLAEAVVRDGGRWLEGQDVSKVDEMESITGKGVKARMNGTGIYIGNKELFEEDIELKLPDDINKQVEKLENEGKTTMIIQQDEQFVGVIGLMDTPREDAASVINRLKRIGLSRLIMLTGDNQRVADAVAKKIGIDDPKGNLLPEDKVEAINKLRGDNRQVAMVGDGVNDAPAMANSTVGIAMGAAGSDVALETADVALMANKISVLPFAIGLSRKTKSIIKQNLWISLGMVAILVPSTILGLSMGPAVLGHEGSTVLVVFNSLRLLGYNS